MNKSIKQSPMAKKGTVSRFLLIELLCRNRSKFFTYPPREATVINQTKREQYCLFIFSLSALLLSTATYKMLFFHLKSLARCLGGCRSESGAPLQPLGIWASLVRNRPTNPHISTQRNGVCRPRERSIAVRSSDPRRWHMCDLRVQRRSPVPFQLGASSAHQALFPACSQPQQLSWAPHQALRDLGLA